MHNRLIYMFQQKMGKMVGQIVQVIFSGNTCVTNVNKRLFEMSDGMFFPTREVQLWDRTFQETLEQKYSPTLLIDCFYPSLDMTHAVRSSLEHLCYIINFNDFFTTLSFRKS